MSESDWYATPLTWGEGPSRFEVFLEPSCPFSACAFGKLWDLLDAAGPDRVTVGIRLLSQPWHMFSGFLTRAIIAASTQPEGREQARKVMAAIFAHREEFEFQHHCGGPNLDCTPRELIARIERYSGVPIFGAFAIPDLDRAVKWHARYSRQNGIHVSPSFMVDGLLRPDIGSGDSVTDWCGHLKQP
jgi:hypothetical protein